MITSQHLRGAVSNYWGRIYAQGVEAFHNGHYTTACPYSELHLVRREHWLKGWTDAQSIVLNRV